jgi:hypothetical protein
VVSLECCSTLCRYFGKKRNSWTLSGVELTLSKFEYMFLGSVYVSEYMILTGHQIIIEHKLLLKL